MTLPTPFSTAGAVVRPEWIDYNGHMNVGYYHVAFDVAADVFFEFLGLDPGFRERHGSTTFALEAHLNFLREVGIRRLWFAGLATDFCVLWSTLDARAAGFEATVIEDACRAIDLNGSLDAAWKAMDAAGVERTRADRLRI